MLDKVLTKISKVSNIKVLFNTFYSFLFFPKHRSSFVVILPFIESLGSVCHFTRINDRKIVFCCSHDTVMTALASLKVCLQRSSLHCFPSTQLAMLSRGRQNVVHIVNFRLKSFLKGQLS